LSGTRDLRQELVSSTAAAAAVEDSRRRLLAAIAGAADLTFVRGVGNLGDELIFAGTRRLLAGLPYREVALDELPRVSGDTALLSGGGAWCQPYHELMPQMLPLAELRFARVVVLPSSFDLGVPEVRFALRRTRALVFAREAESFRQLREICRAELAHDCAFFFDFAPFARAGRGVLQAFRSDREAAGPAPDGSVDISLRCSSLDEWLWTIAAHELVLTDRAHVMIAAALLGKRVEYRPSSYHKLSAIADYALGGYDVRRLDRPLALVGPPAPPRSAPAPRAAPDAAAVPAADPPLERVRARLLARARQDLALLRPELLAGDGPPRLTLVVLACDRPGLWPRLLRSLDDHLRMATRLLVIDDHSAPAAHAELRRLCSRLAGQGEECSGSGGGIREVELLRLERRLGCTAARRHAAGLAATEYLAFLDDDSEVFPGTFEHLVQALDAHPEAVAAGGHLVLPDGRTQLCGGDYWEQPDGVLHFEALGQGLDFEDPAVGPSRPCQWLAGAALVVRRSALAVEPLDPGMAAYYEDNEWCYRVGRCRPPGAFRRVVQSLALHYQELKGPRDGGSDEVTRSLPYLQSLAHFYEVHGRVLEGVFVFAPRLAPGGRRDVAAARLLLELLAARGPDWLRHEWLRGGLAPLFDGDAVATLAAATRELATVGRQLQAERERAAAAERERTAAAERERLAAQQLAAIHGSRLWRLASVYWRLRRATAGRRGA
jgi:Glycosyl transferase family 2/Polysaccharide pyruvyl transferase